MILDHKRKLKGLQRSRSGASHFSMSSKKRILKTLEGMNITEPERRFAKKIIEKVYFLPFAKPRSYDKGGY